MPGFDRSGPMGAGPRTGGGFGYCGRNADTAAIRGFGAGGGFRRGRRNASNYGGMRGRRFRPRNQDFYPANYPQMGSEQERDVLMDHIANLKVDLTAMEDRIAALDDSMGDKIKD